MNTGSSLVAKLGLAAAVVFPATTLIFLAATWRATQEDLRLKANHAYVQRMQFDVSYMRQEMEKCQEELRQRADEFDRLEREHAKALRDLWRGTYEPPWVEERARRRR